MVKWRVVYTKQAQKDAKRIAAAGLRPKAEKLLEILAANPFQTPPRYEKLMGDLSGAYSAESGRLFRSKAATCSD
jgi:Txe/YoeB family toxin of Txe-Axe toxin-antitoxin module